MTSDSTGQPSSCTETRSADAVDHVARSKTNKKPVRRRASRACQYCRGRKVRCNVEEQGPPCTNCKLDKVPCTVKKTKWRRGRGSFVIPHPDVTHDQLGAHGSSATTTEADREVANRSDMTLASSNTSADLTFLSPNTVSLPRPLDHSLIYQFDMNLQRDHDLTASSTTDDLLFESNFVKTVIDPVHCEDVDSNGPASQSTRLTYSSLPAYIKAFPDSVLPDEVYYLWKKGALSIPEPTLRDELLRCYIEFVYPYMPATELYDILRIIDQGDGTYGKISLLLFQGIMFAGSAFANITLLQSAGYRTRMIARKAFYDKLKAIYDSDYETDRVTLVQSLLLMSQWYGRLEDQKDPWYWMGIAISLAHTAGLHRNYEGTNIPIKKQHLWRRIWWSCYMRDHLVSLGLSRPTRIRDEDYNVPMLTVDDFEIGAFCPDDVTMLPTCMILRHPVRQANLAAMCILEVKLYLCISQILTGSYNLMRDRAKVEKSRDERRPNFMIFPGKAQQIEKMQLCDANLADWIQTLPDRFVYSTPTKEEVAAAGASFVVQRSLLHMIYFATVSTLHRLLILPSAGITAAQNHHIHQYLSASSRNTTRRVSQEIAKICKDLHSIHLDRVLPPYSLTILVPAIMIHLLDLKSSNKGIREEALQGFCHCTLVMDKLRDMNAAAIYATAFVEAAIKRMGIDVSFVGGSSTLSTAGPVPIELAAPNISKLINSAKAAKAAKPAKEGNHSSSTLHNREFEMEPTSSMDQNFEDSSRMMDIEGTDLNVFLDPFMTIFGSADRTNGQWWDNSVDGVMNGEAGSLLFNMN